MSARTKDCQSSLPAPSSDGDEDGRAHDHPDDPEDRGAARVL